MAPLRQLHTIAVMEAAAQPATTASHSDRFTRRWELCLIGLSDKVRQFAEQIKSVVNLLARKRLQPFRAEALARK
jgi:hypothetical protein